MRVPVLNTNPKVAQTVRSCFVRESPARAKDANPDAGTMEPVPIGSYKAAIEYINYQMPALILINFSDARLNAWEVMKKLVSDPWLNNGGIIALYEDQDTYRKVEALQDTNILISLHVSELLAQLPTVLEVISNNRQILSQRAIQSDLLSTISGQFVLGMDLALVPCYANLVSNYLYNMGFVDGGTRTRVALMLTEMLINAIEHGNCGIPTAEKSEFLAKHGDMRLLIAEKCRDSAVAGRKVFFGYSLEREHSTFVIRDEGGGFNWREFVKPGREVDTLSLNGRGILLTVETASRLEYNEAGNEVTLEVQHRRNVSNEIPNAFKDNDTVLVVPGQEIFRQGEESSFIYYVAEGEYNVLVNGRPVAVVTPEDVFMGEMSFLLEETRSATVIANTPGKLIKISKESLVNAIKKQPYYGMFLAKLLAQRLVRQNRFQVNKPS